MKSKKPFYKRPWVIVLEFVIFIIFIAIAFSGGDNETKEASEYKQDNTLACVMAQDFVDDRLTSPYSAKFQPCYETRIK